MSTLSVIFILAIAVLILRYITTRGKPLHVKVKQKPMAKIPGGFNIFPLIITMFQMIPESIRRNLVIQQSAPKQGSSMRDRQDCTGESPYITKELVPGKLWQVAYDMEQFFITDPKHKEDMKSIGLDPLSQEFQDGVLAAAEQYGPEVVEVAKKDLETAEYWYSKDKIEQEDVFKHEPMRLNSFVVKMKNGSLLLYAPNKIREEHKTWLQSLGEVEWVVIPSNAHTLSISQVLNLFPQAKTIGPETAQAKLLAGDGIPQMKFNYLANNPEDMKIVNIKLGEEGVKLVTVEGDVVNSVMLVAHNILLECDIIYTHLDGEGMFMINKERFRQLLPEDWSQRLFKFGLTCKPSSPNGFLPPYRYWALDPTVLGNMIGLDKAAPDGSTCSVIARSLRSAMKSLEFDFMAGVHFDLMSGVEFRKTVDASWNWLDGKSIWTEQDQH